MTRLPLLALLLTALLAAACQSAGNDDPNAAAAEATEATADAERFGAAFDPAGAIDFAALPARLEGHDSLRVTVTGQIDAVCQKKGCWMTLRADGAPEMMVKFRDYGYFVPMDIAGRRVAVDGVVRREETSVEDLRHLARDAGKPEAEVLAITAPETTLQFIADGVVLLPEG